MNINQLNVFGGTQFLQKTQTIGLAEMADGTVFLGIYDSSNGHWLTIPDKTEVGYNGDFRLNGKNHRAVFIREFVPGQHPSKDLEYVSHADWPADCCPAIGNHSDDTHGTFESAQGVIDLLKRNGFGGDGKHFPVKTWIEVREVRPKATT